MNCPDCGAPDDQTCRRACPSITRNSDRACCAKDRDALVQLILNDIEYQLTGIRAIKQLSGTGEVWRSGYETALTTLRSLVAIRLQAR